MTIQEIAQSIKAQQRENAELRERVKELEELISDVLYWDDVSGLDHEWLELVKQLRAAMQEAKSKAREQNA